MTFPTLSGDSSPASPFSYNAALGTIDIAGFNMGRSAKYRNIQVNPRVAFVVDEVTEASMEGSHFLEIRGIAEAVAGPAPADTHLVQEIIRIHPRRVIAFNVDPDDPGLQTRDVAADGTRINGPAL
jgi:pyridoxamine 5'-phosphate oxidase family protein